MARGGYRTWATTDRFQADWNLRNAQTSLAIARKVLWDAIAFEGAKAEVVTAMRADLERARLRLEEAEADVARIEQPMFARPEIALADSRRSQSPICDLFCV